MLHRIQTRENEQHQTYIVMQTIFWIISQEMVIVWNNQTGTTVLALTQNNTCKAMCNIKGGKFSHGWKVSVISHICRDGAHPLCRIYQNTSPFLKSCFLNGANWNGNRDWDFDLHQFLQRHILQCNRLVSLNPLLYLEESFWRWTTMNNYLKSFYIEI